MSGRDTVQDLRSRRRGAVADVVVTGAGMVGAASALALARDGLRVVLVEARLPRTWQAADDVDLRVVALAPSSVALLQDLGVWESIREARAHGYTHMHVWDAFNGAGLDFDAGDIDAAHLGWIVENRLLQTRLWQALEAAGVELRCPARVRGFEHAEDHVRVDFEEGESLKARVLVAADGAASPLREQAGIATRGHGYDQQGVVAHVETAKPHADTAWQRFLPGGPIALLPLADGRCSMVWTLPDHEARRVLELDDAAFADAVGVASDFRLGLITASSARAAFPLRMQLAERYVQDRLVLVGDAAHVVHPLAGQGVNLGLRDLRELRACLRTAHARGIDIGAHHALRVYARRRRSADTLDALAMNGLVRTFGEHPVPLKWLRGMGMHACNRLPMLKRALAAHAAG